MSKPKGAGIAALIERQGARWTLLFADLFMSDYDDGDVFLIGINIKRRDNGWLIVITGVTEDEKGRVAFVNTDDPLDGIPRVFEMLRDRRIEWKADS